MFVGRRKIRKERGRKWRWMRRRDGEVEE